MRLLKRRHRSGGVRVSPATARWIAGGDRARAAGDWREAARHYEAALGDAPDLYHIRVQLGHALKEHGDHAGAEAAYRVAVGQRPGDRDAALHLGHILKVRGAITEAAETYVALALADPDDEEAMREARETLARIEGDGWRRLADEMARRLAIEPEADSRFPPIESCELVFDLSDLLSYYARARRPTGIQRVQTETVVRALEAALAGGRPAAACSFVGGRDEWVEVPGGPLLALIRLSVAEDDGDAAVWRRARDRFLLTLLVGRGFAFRRRAILVNLGTSWWLQNYFLRVRDAQMRRDITYIPMIHDLIPVLFPDFCVDALVQDFLSWLSGALEHTRTFFANSESSKRDLIACAARLGHAVSPELVSVVTLDADFSGGAALAAAALPAGLGDEPFVVLVSTIEPRKGHLQAFDAWSLLIDRLGAANVPRLVCVGRDGWRNAAVYDRLARDDRLRGRVTMLANLSDGELGAMYRRSLFTIYPSLYEGWGLPVTEALCRGKVVVTTTSSSLPEAGGDFARFVPPDDAVALAGEVERLILDPAARLALERRIARDFRPRTWQAIAGQIGDQAQVLDARDRAAQPVRRDRPPVARPGRVYWLARPYAMELRAQPEAGEAFRAGLHWHPPEDWGCRVKPAGAELAMTVGDAAPGTRLTLTVRLVGSHRARCAFHLVAGDRSIDGVLGRLERRSVAVPMVVPPDLVLRLGIAGTTGEVPDDRSPAAERALTDTVGVEAFHLAPDA